MKEIKTLFVDINKDEKITFKCPHCEREYKLTTPKGKKTFRVKCRCEKILELKMNQREGKRRKFEELGFAISSGKRVLVKIKDLSVGGMSFESVTPIERGEITVSFKLRFSKKIKDDVFCSLRIVSKDGNKYGAQFVGLEDFSPEKQAIYWFAEVDEPLEVEIEE